MVEVCLENGLLLSLLKFILPTSPLRNGITMVTSLPFLYTASLTTKWWSDLYLQSPFYLWHRGCLNWFSWSSNPVLSPRVSRNPTIGHLGWITISVFPGLSGGIMEHRTFSSEMQNIPGNWDKFVSPDWHLPLKLLQPKGKAPSDRSDIKEPKMTVTGLQAFQNFATVSAL